MDKAQGSLEWNSWKNPDDLFVFNYIRSLPLTAAALKGSSCNDFDYLGSLPQNLFQAAPGNIDPNPFAM